MIYLKDYVLRDRIHFLDSETKEKALEKMIVSLDSFEAIKDFKAFKNAVYERENILSTGIGNGVAIPHIKKKNISKFFILIGIDKKGIDWDSIDNKPVHLIFLIGGPDNHELYLRILSKLFLIIKNADIREKLLACSSPQEVMGIFEKY